MRSRVSISLLHLGHTLASFSPIAVSLLETAASEICRLERRSLRVRKGQSIGFSVVFDVTIILVTALLTSPPTKGRESYSIARLRLSRSRCHRHPLPPPSR